MRARTSRSAATELRRIVVGFDGSAAGSAALAWAVEEAGLHGALLEVWAVVESPRLGLHAAADDDTPGLAELRAAAEQIAPGAGADLRVGRGSAAAVLCGTSGASDLLVVGTRGRNPLTDLVLGSVSRACLQHAPCSVVVVRSAPRLSRPHGRVVVGLDGSGPARRALHIAADEARSREAELDVIHTVQWNQMHTPDLIVPATRQLVAWTKALVEEELGETNAAINSIVVNGNPADVLVRQSANADLLVLGSRGHGLLEALALGSTSVHCARHARCPVMIVRPADDDEHAARSRDPG